MPGIDFASHDPEFTPEQEAQCARIVDGLRQINTRAVRLGGSIDSLTAAADRVEALLASLDEVTESRALVTYKFPFDLAAPNDILRFNPATGRYNPVAPELQMEVLGEKLVIRCEFANCYESAPETVQGGMVAAIYDQLLAYVIMVRGFTGPTLWIKVSYQKPTPINVPLRFEAEVDKVDGKKYSVKGVCYNGDQIITEAEGMILGSYELPLEKGGRDA
jgi:acyl-coenzyme A thioesterase PaaI-like protein